MPKNDWEMPLDLRQALPRASRRSRTCRLVIWFGATLCLFPVALVTCIGLPIVIRMQHLEATGHITGGTITGRHTTFSHGHEGYAVGYRFTVPGTLLGQDGESSVSDSQFSSLRVGSPVKVIYETNETDISTLQMALKNSWAHPWIHFAAIVLLGVGISGFAGLIFFGYIGFQFFTERHLLRWGTAVLAQIIGEDEVRERYGRSNRLTYQFGDSDGVLHEGTRGGLPISNYGSIDSAITTYLLRTSPTVVYDPKNPSKSLLYPPALLECCKPLSSTRTGVV